MTAPAVSIIIPCYNSAESVGPVVARLEPVLTAACGVGEFETILVNDGSSDATWDVIRSLSDKYPWVRGIQLMRNFGQHNALLCGIRAANGAVIVTLDDDLQNPPEEVPHLLGKLAEGADVVYGTPQTEQHGLWRDLASQMTKLVLQKSMGAETARQISAFRAFRTQLRDAFADYAGPYVSIDVLLTWGTTRFAAIKVRHDARTLGKSNYTFGKLVVHALNLVTGFSTWPLRVASLTGFGFTLFGMFLLVYVLVRWYQSGGSVPGFAFLASAIAIFSGAQLFALGIIGEYLARLHLRMMDRPAYVVREATGQ